MTSDLRAGPRRNTISAGVFAIVVIAVLGAVWRHRRPDRLTRRTGADVVEGSDAVALACVVAFLPYGTFTAERRIDTVADRERPSLTADVTAARREWEFASPGAGVTARSGTVGDQPLSTRRWSARSVSAKGPPAAMPARRTTTASGRPSASTNRHRSSTPANPPASA